MRNFILGLSFSLVFIAGCVAAQFIVPPVRAGTNPQRWEYLCTKREGEVRPKFTAAANEHGRQGWEMVGMALDTGYLDSFCYKRPLP